MQNPMLFSPFEMRSLKFKNRIMVSPMAQYSAIDGCASNWHLMHLGNLAISGAGSLVIEATAVSPSGLNTPVDLGLWNDKQQAALEPIISFCRENSNIALGIQLWHAGRKGSIKPTWERFKPLPKSDGGWDVYGPSAIAYPGRWTPISMNDYQISEVIQQHVAAAQRANELGFDFIELHSAHGYLLHSFLSPLSNQRTDEYGGNFSNRMRFLLKVFQAVRDVWPSEKPIGVRLSCSDWMAGGWTIQDSVAASIELKKLGCDYIAASSGGSVPDQKIELGPGYQVPFSDTIRKDASIPTVAVGLITEAKQAEGILASGKADIVALARGLLYNPRWPWHAAIELGVEPDFPAQYERAHPAMRRIDFQIPKRDS